MKKTLKDQKGFTIIEVMIVLVIAAVILLIVFLAVPALQRNSRNTQRKEDVANLLAGANEYSSNASGAMPTTVAQVTDNANVGFYTAAGAVTLTSNAAANLTNNLSVDAVRIVTDAKCSGTNAVASTRSIAILYKVESGNGSGVFACQAS